VQENQIRRRDHGIKKNTVTGMKSLNITIGNDKDSTRSSNMEKNTESCRYMPLEHRQDNKSQNE